MVLYLRSLIFTVVFNVTAFIASAAICVAGVFGHPAAFAVTRAWGRTMLKLGSSLCGMKFTVDGLENLPDEPSVALIKHSSTWETVGSFYFMPRHTWVLKRELMWIPIIGWAFVMLRPIAINRSAGRSAVQQVVRQGAERLRDGMWIVVFPEGTRMPPGQTRRYGVSGALLAQRTGCPLVPIAHNAGDFWQRRSWVKKPGHIRVVIGPPIPTAGREPREINANAQEWIESTMAKISSSYPAKTDTTTPSATDSAISS